MRVAKGGRTLAGLGAGDWFGEIALVTGAPRTATVTATSPVRVLVLDDRSSRRAVAEMPSIALKVMASLGGGSARTRGVLAAVGTSVDSRLAHCP